MASLNIETLLMARNCFIDLLYPGLQVSSISELYFDGILCVIIYTHLFLNDAHKISTLVSMEQSDAKEEENCL